MPHPDELLGRNVPVERWPARRMQACPSVQQPALECRPQALQGAGHHAPCPHLASSGPTRGSKTCSYGDPTRCPTSTTSAYGDAGVSQSQRVWSCPLCPDRVPDALGSLACAASLCCILEAEQEPRRAAPRATWLQGGARTRAGSSWGNRVSGPSMDGDP